ncbi:type III secretion system outer membrane ring subunit SctC [Paraburkholderia agricolaris]|uniref:type III secretion system outer membrane ring subunit SctC n=2 Tax=Paraburkholderia agricolaris TaxID=2152888 RepID=UPI001292B114|nr:type III secretion system outer membrane ring subunit SctC [Paraburkholderia agricolaris]
MNPVRHRLARSVSAALLASLFAATQSAQAAAPPWPSVNYSYYAQNESLARVLSDFAAAFSLTLDMSPAVEGRLTGRFNTASPTDYLNRLGGIYGFSWYTYGGTLYVNRNSDTVTATIPVSGGNTVAARTALTDLGVLDPRFGWGDMPDQGVVMVSGPPQYVALVQRSLAGLPRVDQRQDIAVFRLQHAQVDDRAIQYRDSQIVIPGVATTLRNLLQDAGGFGNTMQPGAPARAVANGALPSLPALAAAAPLAGAAAGLTPPVAAPAAGTQQNAGPGGALLRGAVEPFPALNAVIVQDAPERMPVYAALIKQLDVPTALIEIEAMVIDVEKSHIDELGVNWRGQIGNVAGGVSGGTIALAAGAGTGLLASAGSYFASRIRALEQAGDARVVSRPSVVTSDNVGAVLNLNQTFYVRTVGERVASVTPVTANTTLKVTPRVVQRDGQSAIQMAIDVQDGRVIDHSVDDLPTVVTSAVSTQAVVRDGESLLVGGYDTDEANVSSGGVPFLSKIPVLGYLFGRRYSTTQQRERMFLIRPHVVTLANEVTQSVPPGSLPVIQPPALRPLPALPQPPTSPPSSGLGIAPAVQ